MRGTDAKPERHFAIAGSAAAALLAALPDAAIGHGFGQRYDLPVPLWLYLTGAGAAVAVSFLLLAIFASETEEPRGYFRLNLLRWRVARAVSHRYVLRLVRSLALAFFVVVVAAGFAGVQSPFKNIAPIAVWAISLVSPAIDGQPGAPLMQNSPLLFGIFLITGIVLGKLMRMALDDAIGPQAGIADRLAGAALGAVRVGLVAVTVVLIFDQLVPSDRQPAYLAGSQLRPLLSVAGQRGFKSLPPDVVVYIDRLKKDRRI